MNKRFKRVTSREFTPFRTSESKAMPAGRRGFTLIELLMVIAIIGLLASIIIGSLSMARSKSRDARRLADFQQVQNALELYYSSQTPSSYPSANPGTWAALTTALSAGYMSAVPTDPGTYAYTYQSTKGDAGPTACALPPCEGYLMRMQTEYANYMTNPVTGVSAVPTASCTVSGSAPYNYCIRK